MADAVDTKIIRELGEWLWHKCGDDEDKAHALSIRIMQEYYKHCALLDGFCLAPPK